MIINIDEIRRAHERFIRAHEREVETELEAAGRVGEDHPRQYATFKRRSGELQDKTTHVIVRVGKNKLLRLQNPKRYAAAIDSGTKPHVILPRRARFLRFEVDGKVVFARRVNHPGNRPYKFLYRATFAAYRVLGPNLETALSRVAARF